MKSVVDMPKELYDRFHEIFESGKEIRALRISQQDALRCGQYMKALDIAHTIESLWAIFLDNCIKGSEDEVCKVDPDTMDIPQEDKDEITEKTMVLFMCSDIIESSIIDINDVFHRTNPDSDITTFRDLQQTLDIAKAKLKFLQKSGDYMKDLIFADKCDDMYGLMQSKARSIIRKRKESKNWGENKKKVEKRR